MLLADQSWCAPCYAPDHGRSPGIDSHAMSGPALPDRPPFVLRGRLLTPLGAGGSAWEPDAALEVDESGRLTFVGPWSTWQEAQDASSSAIRIFDLRPWLLLPGLVDLHIHLPQFPSAGLGAGLDLLTWLDRHIFPLERGFDVAAAERLAPAVFRALARAGTTTVLAYGAIWHDSLDVTFRAAEEHGIRAVIGKVMMDRITYDDRLPRDEILDVSLRQSADLAGRWHGRDGGRLRYAFTPRFAVSCSPEMLRESAALARQTGAYWQSHIAEDRAEMAEVLRLFPGARDYLDVYDRAGALGERTILAHAIYLSDREVARLVESGSRVAHCPASNMFLASGVMPLARYLEAGMIVGLGSDVAAAPDLSMVTEMRTGFYAQNALNVASRHPRPMLDPTGWLRLGTLDGARVLGLDDAIGSLEEGKEADIIAIDPGLTAPLPDMADDDPDALLSRLIFRSHPDMVRGAWVRGRLLDAGRPAKAPVPPA
jgi:guanine deaminase